MSAIIYQNLLYFRQFSWRTAIKADRTAAMKLAAIRANSWLFVYRDFHIHEAKALHVWKLPEMKRKSSKFMTLFTLVEDQLPRTNIEAIPFSTTPSARLNSAWMGANQRCAISKAIAPNKHTHASFAPPPVFICAVHQISLYDMPTTHTILTPLVMLLCVGAMKTMCAHMLP